MDLEAARVFTLKTYNQTSSTTKPYLFSYFRPKPTVPYKLLTLFSQSDLQNLDSRVDIYNAVVKRIKPPPLTKTTWLPKSSRTKLSLAIVEPRSSTHLRGVLYNVAHIYGGSEVSLFLFHGTENLAFIKEITSEWTNIEYVNLNVATLKYPKAYNALLVSSGFYAHFNSEFVLVFQTDTLMRHAIPEHLFIYDYIGAPWPHNPAPEAEHRVGNGGFSLRRVSEMQRIAQFGGSVYENEDVFIVRRVRKGGLPSVKVAKEFAAEMQSAMDPVGLHQVYKFLTMSDMIRLLADVAGLEYAF